MVKRLRQPSVGSATERNWSNRQSMKCEPLLIILNKLSIIKVLIEIHMVTTKTHPGLSGNGLFSIFYLRTILECRLPGVFIRSGK